MARPLYILAPVGSLERLPRTSKIRALLEATGRPLVHLAWQREDGEEPTPGAVTTQVVLQGGGYRPVGAMKWYVRYLLANYRALKRLPPESELYCLGIFAAFPAAWLRRKRFRVLFDHNDNISKSVPMRPLFRRVAEALEHFAIRRAKIHLVPGEQRWPHADASRRIVPNVPSKGTSDEASRIATERGYTRGDQLTLYVNGWLTETRGVGVLLRAAPDFPKVGFRLLLAGEFGVADQPLKPLLDLPCTEYLGRVSQAEALAHYWQSDLAFTYYDPAIEINRLAEPNKWGDCILTGTPILCNQEVVTAKPYVDAGVAFTLPFDDSQGLADLLNRLVGDRKPVAEAMTKMQSFACEPWDQMMSGVITDWLGK